MSVETKGDGVVKLNPDCVRDILLEVEEGATWERPYSYSIIENPPSRLEAYETGEIIYHVRQCELGGYLDGYCSYLDGSFVVDGLTPKGHAFVADLRSDTVWNRTKSRAAKIGLGSLDVLKDIAAQVIAEVIKGN